MPEFLYLYCTFSIKNLKMKTRNLWPAIIALILIKTMPVGVIAQDLYYELVTETDVEYQTLENGTVLSQAGWNNANYEVPVNFPLDFLGLINTDPITNSNTLHGVDLFRPDFINNSIYLFIPYHTALQDIGNYDPGMESLIRYEEKGEEGEKVLSIEYYKAGFTNIEGPEGPTIHTTFKISFLEHNGEIQLHFGPQENREFFNLFHEREGEGPWIYFSQNVIFQDNDVIPEISGVLSGVPDNPTLRPFFGLTPPENLGLNNDPEEGTLYRFIPRPSSTGELSENREISVWPAVTTDFVNVRLSEGIDPGFDYLLIDAGGRVLQNGKISSHNDRIEFHNIPAGHYFLRFENGGESTVKKIVLMD